LTIKQALKFIFNNATKIGELAVDNYMPAANLRSYYVLYLLTKDNEKYCKPLIKLCKEVKKYISRGDK